MMLKGKSSILLAAFLCILISSSLDSVVGFAANKHRSINISSRRCLTSLCAKGGGSGKKKKPKKAGAQTIKGFGAPPPKLEDVLAAFKMRIPEGAEDKPCPCESGIVYNDCCGPLHRGDRLCLTMTDVLRSRYTAFSWRNIGHVMSTTHPSCRDYREDQVKWANDLDKGGMFDSFEFVKLEVGPEVMSEDNENEGFVQFKVTLRAKEGSNGSIAAGEETKISERSRFLRDPNDGSWSYASGDVRSDVAGLEDTTLNA